jgi:hypothetical protein
MLRPRRTHEILGGRLRKGGCAHQLGWWLEVQALPRTRHKVPSGAQGDAQLVGHGLGRWLAENLGEHMDDGGEINVVIGTSPISPWATWGDGKPERAAQAQLRHPVWIQPRHGVAPARGRAHRLRRSVRDPRRLPESFYKMKGTSILVDRLYTV